MSGSIFGGSGFNVGKFAFAGQQPGRWFAPNIVGQGTSAIAANKLYACPLISPISGSVDKASLRVSTGSAGLAKIGIYTALSTGFPGSLIGEISIDIDTASPSTLDAPLIAGVNLVAGQLYWLATCFSATPTVATISAFSYFATFGDTNVNGPFLPRTGSMAKTSAVPYISGPTPFLPTTFGAAAESVTTPYSPLVGLRCS